MFSTPFNLERCITINKPLDEVYQYFANFNDWATWSPWIIQEPSCPTKVYGKPAEVGHKQEWRGERIGSGQIEIIATVKNQSIDYDLLFLSPWKSHSKTQLQFQSVTNSDQEDFTKVTWSMQGSLPIFMFFMKKMMTVYVGGDYTRGLTMAKEALETGQVTSSVAIEPISQKEGFYYIGWQADCAANKVSEAVGPAFSKLHDTDLPHPDFVASIVNHFDMVKNTGSLVAAYGYKQRPDITLPPGMVEGIQPPHRALEVIHTGSYYHIPNGWVTLMNYMRFKKLKANKKAKDYEVYLNSPTETPAAELKTAIISPIK